LYLVCQIRHRYLLTKIDAALAAAGGYTTEAIKVLMLANSEE